MAEERLHDVVIVGAGPAGLAAAIYAGRSGLDTVLLDMMGGGGQVNMIDRVENYPGVIDLDSGAELAEVMRKQTESFGVTVTYDEVQGLDPADDEILVKGSSSDYKSRSVILASGAGHKKLKVPGEGRLYGKGVSNCATCDGAFFKGQPVAIVGGGSSAVMEAVYLTRMVGEVTLIHRRDKLRAEKVLQDRFFAADNSRVMWNSEVKEILGKDEVTGVEVVNKKTGETSKLDVAAVFIFVGIIPNTNFLKDVVEMDDFGFIKTDISMRTSHPHIFAAGDVRVDSARQIGTAVGDGITAAINVQEIIDEVTPPRQYETM